MDEAIKILSDVPEFSYDNPSAVCYIGTVMPHSPEKTTKHCIKKRALTLTRCTTSRVTLYSVRT